MSTPLWTDERMAMRWVQIATEIVRRGGVPAVSNAAYEQLLREVRDEYQARVDRLEACADPEALTIAYGLGRADAYDRAKLAHESEAS